MGGRQVFNSFKEMNKAILEKRDNEKKKILEEEQQLDMIYRIKAFALELQESECLIIHFRYDGKNKELSRMFAPNPKKIEVNNFVKKCLALERSQFSLYNLEKIEKIINGLIKNNNGKKLEKLNKEKLEKEIQVKKEEEERQAKSNKEQREKKEKSLQKKKKAIDEECKARGIEKMYHFTRVENLLSILEIGIVPREVLEKTGREFAYCDENRYDRRKDCTCLSIEYPNMWLLNKKKNEHHDWEVALIELDASLLLKYDAYFAKHNAAAGDSKIDKKIETFRELFSEEFKIDFWWKEKTLTFKREEGCANQWPTSDQAEVLIQDTIDITFIRNVIFKNDENMRRYEKMLKNKGLKYRTDLDMFKYRRAEYYRRMKDG